MSAVKSILELRANQPAERYSHKSANAQLVPVRPSVLCKLAATIGEPDLVSGASGATLGRLTSAMSPGSWIISGPRHLYPADIEPNAQEKLIAEMSKAEPNAIKDTLVRLGAGNIIDDMIYKRDYANEGLSWDQRIGGRWLQNKKTGPLMKALGPLYNSGSYLASMFRMPHYNYVTDVAHNPWGSRAITAHELGHASDFSNLMSDKGKLPEDFFKRMGVNSIRDLYALSYALPFANLYHEYKANRNAYDAVRESKDKKFFDKTVEEMQNELPAAYGSYVGYNLPVVGALSPLVGTVAGKGISMANREQHLKLLQDDYKRHHAEKKKKKKSDD